MHLILRPSYGIKAGPGFREKRRMNIMAQRCDICGKGPMTGNKVSHAHNLTRRRWLPNIQKVRAVVDGSPKYVKACTRCIRSGKVTKAPRA